MPCDLNCCRMARIDSRVPPTQDRWGAADVAGLFDFEHGIERALLGAAAGAEGHRKILRVQQRQFVARGAQLFSAFRRLRRKEFDTEIMRFHFF